MLNIANKQHEMPKVQLCKGLAYLPIWVLSLSGQYNLSLLAVTNLPHSSCSIREVCRDS